MLGLRPPICGLPRRPSYQQRKTSPGWRCVKLWTGAFGHLGHSRANLLPAIEHVTYGLDTVSPQPRLSKLAATQPAATADSSASNVTAALKALERLEGMSATDSMDSFYSDMADDDPAPFSGSSTGSQERSSTAYAYNKSNYEVLRLDAAGRTRKFFVRRRDLLREYRMQPRDLRRIDPTIDFTKTSPSITIKENVLLLCLGGVRAIVTAEKALLFEPASAASQRFMDTIVPHLEAKADQHNNHQVSGSSSNGSSSRSNKLGGGGLGSNLSHGGGGGGGGIGMRRLDSQTRAIAAASHTEYMARFYAKDRRTGLRAPPFELEVLEGALIVATGRLDAEMVAVTRRVGELLSLLPGDINPVSLEELRRVKGALVELENKADTLRNMLEELMDDEDELRELNLSSRPRREERKRQRERERLERELERARELKEELEERLEEDEEGGSQRPGNSSSHSTSSGPGGNPGAGGRLGHRAPAHYIDASGEGYASWTGGLQLLPPLDLAQTPSSSPSPASALPSNGLLLPPREAGGMEAGAEGQQGPAGGWSEGEGPRSPPTGQGRIAELRAKYDRDRLAGLRSKFSWSRAPGGSAGGPLGVAAGGQQGDGGREMGQAGTGLMPGPGQGLRGLGLQPGAASQQVQDVVANGEAGGLQGHWRQGEGSRGGDKMAERAERLERWRMARASNDGNDGDWISRLEQQLEGSEEDIQEAQEALEEMVEAEEEEQEVEEVEDLLEYYLQRASAVQSEAERLLAGARDLEESIGVSLSARRYEVNRLELTLSIGSFAAAIGAMIAGIFGMNMKSMLEMSVASFWGISGAIVVGCIGVFVAIMRYTRKKRIL
ncbi:hypothetical protein QJQ45_025221 [Haematococcus lacustris]|nr:hypothetical protein QJQ45_025221 [Haematococcus lacustris]